MSTRNHSRYAHRALLGVVLSYFAALAPQSLAAEVWVITDARHPVKAPREVRVIELDAPARIEARLAADLPAEPDRAARVVQQRLQEGGTNLQTRLAAAHQGVVDAWSLGITRIPAVLVDRRYVVYGDADVERALARIARHREQQP